TPRPCFTIAALKHKQIRLTPGVPAPGDKKTLFPTRDSHPKERWIFVFFHLYPYQDAINFRRGLIM
ncbi:TPA: hypothetical protein ACRGC1_005387, partial [Klebsiella pneumoniae]